MYSAWFCFTASRHRRNYTIDLVEIPDFFRGRKTFNQQAVSESPDFSICFGFAHGLISGKIWQRLQPATLLSISFFLNAITSG